MGIKHITTRKTKYYTVRFDKKEFRVKVIDVERHRKDTEEITNIEITQVPSIEDLQKVYAILDKKEQ